MSNIPIVAFDSVEHLGDQSGIAPLSPSSEESSFDLFLKDAGDSLEEVDSKTTSTSQEAGEADSPNSSATETDKLDQETPDEEVQASAEGDQGEIDQIENSEGDEPGSVSDEGQDESDGQAKSKNGPMNLTPGGKLPFPQLVEDGAAFDGRPVGAVLASQRSGISIMGNRDMSVLDKAAGEFPGANALNRQLELQAGIAGQGEGAKNESGNENPGKSVTGLNNAAGHVPAVMPETSSFGGAGDGEGNSVGMMFRGSASPAAGPQNSDPEATPLNGQEVSELGAISPDGESVTVSGEIVAEGDVDNGLKPLPANKNPEEATLKTGDDSDSQAGSSAGSGSETSQENDASEVLRTQFVQPGSDDGEKSAANEGASSSSAREAINPQEILSAKAGPELVSLDVKTNPDLRVAAQQEDVPLRARVQEQVLETAVARVGLAIRNKVSHARIQLDPPSLGRVDMHLQVEGGALTAKVTVENAWVKDAITANLKELHDALEEHGVRVEQFSVDVDAGMNSWMSDQAFEGEDFTEALYLESDPLEEEDSESALAEAGSSSSDADDGSTSVDLFA